MKNPKIQNEGGSMTGGQNNDLGIPNVVIDDEGGRKYIVAKIVDTQRVDHLVVRANEWCEYHRDILNDLRKECDACFRAQCVGGGYINVDPEKKKIIIWGSSGDFGREPSRKATVQMLQNAFPKFTVVNK